MQIVKISKIVEVETKFDMLRLQLILHKFVSSLSLSDAEINTISLLAEKGYYKGIYKDAVEYGYFKTEQSARNCIMRAVNSGLLLDRKSKYKLNPALQISTDEFVLLDIKAHNINETKEQEVSD